MLIEHTTTIETTIAPAAPLAGPAAAPHRGNGTMFLVLVVASELVWIALLVWFAAGVIV